MSTARRRDGYPSLRKTRTKDLIAARDYMIGEVEACLDGICPEHVDAFAAAAVLFDRELRRRDPRRRPLVLPGDDR